MLLNDVEIPMTVDYDTVEEAAEDEFSDNLLHMRETRGSTFAGQTSSSSTTSITGTGYQWREVVYLVMLFLVLPLGLTMAWLQIPLRASYIVYIAAPAALFHLCSMILSTLFFTFALLSLGARPRKQEMIILWLLFWMGYGGWAAAAYYYPHLWTNDWIMSIPACWLLIIQLSIFTYQVKTHPDVDTTNAKSALCGFPKVAFWMLLFFLNCILQWFVVQRVQRYFDDSNSVQSRLVAVVIFQVTRGACSALVRLFAKRIPHQRDPAMMIRFAEYGHFFSSFLFALMYRALFRAVSSTNEVFMFIALRCVMDFIEYFIRLTHTYWRCVTGLDWCPRLIMAVVKDEPTSERNANYLYRLYFINKMCDWLSLLTYPVLIIHFVYIQPDHYPSFSDLTTDTIHRLLYNIGIFAAGEIILLTLHHGAIHRWLPHVHTQFQRFLLFRNRPSRLLYVTAITHLLMVMCQFFQRPIFT